MVSLTGLSPSTDITAITGTPTAGIEAQLARYEKELSDCVNCASAKTPGGRAAIEALSNKINTAKARIEKLTIAKQDGQAEASNISKIRQLRLSGYGDTRGTQSAGGIDQALSTKSGDFMIGSLVNIMA